MRINADDLRDLAERILVAAGADAGSASLTARSLVDADLRGHASHGIRLLPGYAARLEDGRVDGAAVPQLVDDHGTTCTVDAGGTLGQAVAPWLAALAVARAREHGVAAIAVRRCAHLGRLYDLAERIASSGAIGIVFANDSGRNAVVVPFGGTVPRLATNPVAIGIPRREPPHLVLDMATSVTSHGTLAAGREAGCPDPEGAADGDALLPAAGAKGTGLALATDVLAGVLGGSGFAGAAGELDFQGILVLALDPARFVDPAIFVDGVETVVAHVKDGNQGVVVPGETGEAARASSGGWVRVPEATWVRVAALAEAHGIDVPPATEEDDGSGSTPLRQPAWPWRRP